MSKKVLMIATYGDFFAAFETNNIKILNDMGYEVHLCANWKDSRYNYKHSKLEGLKYVKINIEFDRHPFNFNNIKCYRKLCRLMKQNNYYLVDCHNAVIGVYARIAANINKIPKVMYTAHGFQFFKGGSKKDWIIYYPIEKMLSFFTNKIIVINKEDYNLAKNKFKCNIEYIHGVGFDSSLFMSEINREIKSQYMDFLNIPMGSFIIISVGELSKRKNHQVIIKAIYLLQDRDIHYFVVGQGSNEEELKILTKELHLSDNIHFLGHRSDIFELNKISNIAAFPSLREGLGIAGLESMSAGLPLVTSGVQGIKDYNEDGITGFNILNNSVKEYSQKIAILKNNIDLREHMSKNAIDKSRLFDIKIVDLEMRKIYRDILKDEGI